MNQNPQAKWFCMLAAFLAAAGSGCSLGTSKANKAADSKSESVTVAAFRVESQPITRTVEVVGTLWPDDQVVVSSQVEGQVERIHVDVGDSVQAGRVMVSLDSEELRYQIESRTGNLHKIMAQLGLADEKSEVQDVAELPEARKAAAQLLEAEQRVRRLRDLHQQELATQQDLDTAEARFRSARAEYDVVLQQVRTLQAQLRSERAELNLARKKLRDAEIRAPFSGFVQERHVSPGQYLRVQAPVMTLVKPDPLKLRADVPERMAHWIQVGQNMEATTEAFPERKFSGKIRRIAPAVKEQSRSFSVEALLDNRQLLLKPGVFVKSTVTTSKVDSVLLVPENALLYLFGIYKVYVVENGRLAGREVKLGDRFAERMEVTEGLRAGEWVALYPEKLREGLAVRVEKRPPS